MRTIKFTQYGLGKAALFNKNMVRAGIWDIPESDIPVKIDRHALRMAVGVEVVDPIQCLEKRDWSGKLPKALVEGRDLMIRQGN